MRRIILLAVAVLALIVAGPAAAKPFPDRIALPNGFFPEGIVIAPGGTFYVGSLSTGAIYRGDLRTGQGSIFIPSTPGHTALGLDYDNGRLFVAGGFTGMGWVYDARTGALLASYTFFPPPATFINDVEVTKDGAYFTDSMQPQLYRVVMSPNGALGGVQTIPLSGEYVHVPGDFNINGIASTPNGKTLVLVQTSNGFLYTTDPKTGVSERIDTGSETFPTADGVVLDGKTLYVSQFGPNRVSVIPLTSDLSAADGPITHMTSPELDFSTTIDEFGNRLYVVNSRFGTPPGPTTQYWITQLSKR